MNNYCVYCHTTPSGRKYVGISCDPLKRWNNGKGYCLNYLFYRAIKKYGWDNIKHEILFENLTIEEAQQKEIELITKWKLIDHRYGYNLQTGGGGPISSSTRLKMSKARKGNKNCKGRILKDSTKEKITVSLKEYYKSHKATFTGRHHKQETIEKLKSRVFTEETKQKMRNHHRNVSGSMNPSARSIAQYSLDGEFIRKYPYATLAAKEFGLDLSSLIKCCKHKVKSCGGYKWEYSD